MPTCLIGLGSNLGDRQKTLDEAVVRLARQSDINVTRQSRWIGTSAVGGPTGQEPFLNGTVILETSLEPQALMAILRRVEEEFGRRRMQRWGPRLLDLDLLLYDQIVLEDRELTVPHPRMAWRRFVLQPTAEIAPDMLHPTTGWTITELLRHLDEAAEYIAITGPVGAGKTGLAERLACETDARLICHQPDAEKLVKLCADSSGSAWNIELEFFNERIQRLASGLAGRSDRKQLVVSDFWIDQSLAFASVWLAADDYAAFCERWTDRCREVARPKFAVALDAPSDQLRERIRPRGPCPEHSLNDEVLERIRQAILALATSPGHGPVLRLKSDEPGRLVDEVVAAMESSKPNTLL